MRRRKGCEEGKGDRECVKTLLSPPPLPSLLCSSFLSRDEDDNDDDDNNGDEEDGDGDDVEDSSSPLKDPLSVDTKEEELWTST